MPRKFFTQCIIIMLHKLEQLFETIGKGLFLPTCMVNLFTCHIDEFFLSLSPISATNLKLRLKS